MPTYLQSDQSLFSLHEASRNAMLSTVEWQLVPVILFRCKDWSILVWEPKDWFPCEITHFITQYIWEGCVKSFQFIPPSRLALTCLIVSLKCRAHSLNTIIQILIFSKTFSVEKKVLQNKCYTFCKARHQSLNTELFWKFGQFNQSVATVLFIHSWYH